MNRYLYQVHLRFCLPQNSAEQDDNLPNNLCVIVNKTDIPFPVSTHTRTTYPKLLFRFIFALYQYFQPFIPVKRADEPRKRPAVPLNITPNLKLAPLVINNIQILPVNVANNYVVSAYLVKQLTWTNLMEQLKSKGIQSADWARTFSKWNYS